MRSFAVYSQFKLLINQRCRFTMRHLTQLNKFSTLNILSYPSINKTIVSHRRELFFQTTQNLKTKFLSTCSMKSKNTNNCDAKDEKTQKALEDDEFQNILKDFAKDFGVGDETSKILDDIRKEMDDPEKKAHTSDGDESRTYVLPGKYKDFTDDDAKVIYSYEEQEVEDLDQLYHVDQEWMPKYKLEAKRGVTGVFDIEELVDVLHAENLLDISVILIPKELHYVDYMVIVTAKSPRHSKAVAELVVKLYKMKKSHRDPFIKTEGKEVPTWKALDMGNIVLHIFMAETRALYDIESLWLFDSTYDNGGNIQVDPLLAEIEQQMAFFNSLTGTELCKTD